MTGTLVNFAAVAVGGSIGCIFKKFIKESYTVSINRVLGLAVLIIGINGVICNMTGIKDSTLFSNGELKLVLYLIFGSLIGEITAIEKHFNSFSKKIESRFKGEGFAIGFVNGSALFCVGAMAIIGSLNDGLKGDSNVLFVKSTLDFTTSIILGATLGYGVIFASIPVLLYQGGITLLAASLQNILQGDVLTEICFVGYAIIMAIGFNFILKSKFKTLNMLPSLVIPVIWSFIDKIL